MSSNGPSNRYGGNPHSTHIGYEWAKDFNKNTLTRHYFEHGKGFISKEDYKSHAIHFANSVDQKNNMSFIDSKKQTHKYSNKTGEFAVIDKNGYIVTYFKPKESIYYLNDKKRNGD